MRAFALLFKIKLIIKPESKFEVLVMDMVIKGKCKKDYKTKDLVTRILPGEIAIINHPDLDDLAAEALIKKRIKALINISPSLSGRYPAQGTKKILDAGIPVIDSIEPTLMEFAKEGAFIEIKENQICHLGKCFPGRRLEIDKFNIELEQSEKSLEQELEKFTLNTLKFAAKEMKKVFAPLTIPKLNISLRERHVLVVVRGKDYQADLFAIRSYVKEVNPILIGVDGGADALMEHGFRPDIIIGDMDSISDRTLKCGAQIIVHGYLDGNTPGEKRVKELQLPYNILPAIGTSEDIALLMAFQEGAELIIALGTHSNLIDFLNKGRDGMASTFLVRLKVGSILVDAKGVSKLYQGKVNGGYFFQMIGAAFLPLIIVSIMNVNISHTLRLLWMRLLLLFGI